MSSLATPGNGAGEPERSRRRYDSRLRRERAAQTRERILAAGSALVHGFPTWEWHGLTFRAVAERAGVSERTVYRHFPTERELHDAVMRRLEEEAGVTYEGLELDGFADLTARTFSTTSSFAVSNWTAAPYPQEPALVAEDLRRREALIRAVTRETADWPDTQRQMAVAMLDVLWGMPAFEHLVTAWKLEGDQATQALTWVIDLVVEAIHHDRRP
jgi:AcrR family transcriptional regulator